MKRINIAAAAILNINKELLLVKKKDSEYYQLAGGKIDKNESKTETVIREIKEEINLIISDSELKFLGDYETIAVNEPNTIVSGTIYLIELKDKFDPIIANEIEDFTWMNLQNYKNYKWAYLAEEFILPIWLKIVI